MKKWTALLLALVMCLSLCACGSAEQKLEEPKPEFVIHNGVKFGMTPEEVSELEPYEINTEDGVLHGYLSGYVEPTKGDYTDYEGYDDASMFYLFDPNTEELQEVYLMFGDYSDSFAWTDRYGTFVSLFTERYGEPTGLDETSHTYAYNDLTTDDLDGLQKEGKVVDAKMWIAPDGDGSVKIELIKATIFGDSYVTYIGMQHLD